MCMEAVNGEVRGGLHRGHMEEEVATQGTCGSVTQYDASSHANHSVYDCVSLSKHMHARCSMEFPILEWRVLGCLV